ncbi:Trp biosynthesis-associated membrane protein [Georgenia alba]|uniref:Trp biosynthesis-associated membrane protein n=1 Tax=Georgenia alba TaxID=2233858 RepID=UPI0036D39BE2
MLAALVLGALLGAVSAVPWASGAAGTVLGEQTVEVSGGSAAPGVVGAAFVVGAAALAVAIGRRAGASVGGVAMVVGAVVAVVAVVGFLGDPESALRQAAAELSGVPELVGDARVTLWPYVTLVLALLAAAVGLSGLVAARTWTTAGRRFERPARRGSAVDRASDERTRAMDDWDALGRGEDPTDDGESRV